MSEGAITDRWTTIYTKHVVIRSVRTASDHVPCVEGPIGPMFDLVTISLNKKRSVINEGPTNKKERTSF